jgi:ATP-binding cassette, subfamily B, bacterial PglK
MLKSLISSIFKILYFLRSFKKFFYILFFFTIICAFCEILFLGSIIPFFSIIFDNQINQSFYYKYLSYIFGDYMKNEVIFFATLFGIFAVLVGIFRLILLKLNISFTAKTSSYLGQILFKNTLLRPYSFHVNFNSSELISAITQKNNDISNIIMSIVLLFSNSILFISIFLLLVILKTSLVLSISGIFLLIYLSIEFFSRKILISNSKLIADNQSKVVKSLQESFGAIKEIILQNLQNFYINIFSVSNNTIHTKIGVNRLISQFPRYVVETFTLLLICFIVLYYENKKLDLVEILPLLTAIAIGVQRLLPLMQQIYFNFSNIVSKKSALDDYIKIFDEDIFQKKTGVDQSKIIFNNEISFKNVNFKYNEKIIFRDLNIEIKKKSSTGIIGKTGAGKTTFIHMLNGLIPPSSGEILIDGIKLNDANFKNWANQITYVPQEIFLFDLSIAENIALGENIEDIDYKKLKEVCKKARILDLINSKQNQFNEKIGEKGIKLSAGEKQRLGIARALYNNPKILILDEATSALDYQTEKEIMTEIYALDKNLTIIIIAHRLNTLESCEKILNINECKIEDTTRQFKEKLIN